MDRPRTVMIVDDDADFVAASRTLLESHGYAVVAAASGAECLEAVRTRRPDLIILDMMMGSITEGFDVSRELRNSERTKRIPIVMVSGATVLTAPLRPDSTWLPVDRVLEKPVEARRLLAVIGELTAPGGAALPAGPGKP